MDELLKRYKAKYTCGEGARFGPQTFLVFFVFTNVFALELETTLYFLSIAITTDPSPAQMGFKFDNLSNFQNLISNKTQPATAITTPRVRKSICDLPLRLKTIIHVSNVKQEDLGHFFACDFLIHKKDTRKY